VAPDPEPALRRAGVLLGAEPTAVADLTPLWAGTIRSTLVRAGRERFVLQQGPRRAIARRARLAADLHVQAPWLPVPVVVAAEVDGRAGTPPFVASRYVDGVSGRDLLADDAGAARLGAAMGRLLPGLAAVPITGLRLSSTWADPERLEAAAIRWLGRVVGELGPGEVDCLKASIDGLPESYAAVHPGFAHGDFVPVNVLLRDGDVVALLDLETARVAHPLFDAARWFAVVGHHHPDRLPAAGSAFLEAAGIVADERTRSDLAMLGRLQALELAARPGAAGTFVRHVELLRSCMRGTPSVAFPDSPPGR
jgi:aminoglycoside phosphotransferase (APT) family kinase protein